MVRSLKFLHAEQFKIFGEVELHSQTKLCSPFGKKRDADIAVVFGG
jgi:hypothetical protein